MNAFVSNGQGKNISAYMGSYGVALSRLAGAVIEANHDKDGIVWPKEVAPWDYYIINLKSGDQNCDQTCSNLYKIMKENSLSVLYDDTDERAGAKLAKADLIGLPYQIIVGPRGVKDKLFDVKNRKSGDVSKLSYNELINFFNIKL